MASDLKECLQEVVVLGPGDAMAGQREDARAAGLIVQDHVGVVPYGCVVVRAQDGRGVRVVGPKEAREGICLHLPVPQVRQLVLVAAARLSVGQDRVPVRYRRRGRTGGAHARRAGPGAGSGCCLPRLRLLFARAWAPGLGWKRGPGRFVADVFFVSSGAGSNRGLWAPGVRPNGDGQRGVDLLQSFFILPVKVQ